MIQSRRIVMPVAAIAILAATLALPAAPVQASVQAAPAGGAETSAVASLWQPLADGLAHLQAGVNSLFAASTTAETDDGLGTGTEIGSGADPNGIHATPGLGGDTSTPAHEPDPGN